MVALQMPEGLQMFACTIADIIERYVQKIKDQIGGMAYYPEPKVYGRLNCHHGRCDLWSVLY